MNDSDDLKNSEMVGYGRPPLATRFKKGKSRNPKGRPKDRRNVGTIFQDALLRHVRIREGDRVRSMPKIEAVIEVNLNKALKGDPRAYAKVMDVAIKLGMVDMPDEQDISKSKRDAAFQTFAKLLNDITEGNTETAPEIDTAPDCRNPRRKSRDPAG
jgi:hypothetical protein